MSSRAIALVGMAGLLGGVAAVVLVTLGANDSSRRKPPVTTSARPQPPPPPPPPARPVVRPGRAVKLAGIRAFDPEGDRAENDDLAPDATDGALSTSWRTERYRNFFKPGVGLVVDAGHPVRLTRVVVRTDTPGFKAEIRVGKAPDGPFVVASPARQVSGRTVFSLRRTAPARYALIWIVDIPDASAAHVNEVTAFGR